MNKSKIPVGNDPLKNPVNFALHFPGKVPLLFLPRTSRKSTGCPSQTLRRSSVAFLVNHTFPQEIHQSV